MRVGRACALFLSIAAIAAVSVVSERALAGDPFSLDDDKADAGPQGPIVVQESPSVATIRAHAYTLAECLALADRNFPTLWAARARLSLAHAQLDEAKWVPFWQWSVSSNATILGRVEGTPTYTGTGQEARALNGLTNGVEPWWTVDISGAVPLYTFGKITAARETAQANVRLNEWDLEHWRQQARMDVRKAFFGAMAARDGRYILKDVISRLEDAIHDVDDKLRSGKPGAEEVDRIRLEYYRDTVSARSGEPDKGERFAMAALRFYTGVQTAFDIPDEPLKRPDVPFAPLVRYLAAARIFRPEVNMSRAGIQVRKSQVDSARANLFPDIGLGLVASYAIAPTADPQYTNVWANDPFNHFYAGGGLGLRWGLDFLPKVARIHEAESQLEEARATERFALGGVAVEVENAYGTAAEADTRERSWDMAEHKAKQWIVTVQNQIDLGTKQEKDLVEPLRAFVDARVNHVTALMDLNVSLSDLARTSGWDAAAPTGM
ncbi:MAG: TolC family protein [Polyangiaceae bacterium]|jgi:outer membrane protein, multidrug efflux system